MDSKKSARPCAEQVFVGGIDGAKDLTRLHSRCRLDLGAEVVVDAFTILSALLDLFPSAFALQLEDKLENPWQMLLPILGTVALCKGIF